MDAWFSQRLPQQRLPVVGLVKADDEARLHLVRALRNLPGWCLAFSAGSVAQALDELRHTCPDVLLVDLSLPDGSGLDLAQWTRRHGHADATAVITTCDNDLSMLQRLRQWTAQVRLPTPAQPGDEALTRREADVLRRVAYGERYDEVARNLGVSTNTVRHHIRGIYAKLGVSSRSHAALEAQRRGWLSPVLAGAAR